MEEKYISLEEYSEQLKEKELAILEWYRKDIKVVKTKFFHLTSNATTLQELHEIKEKCVARKEKLETLIVQKEVHLGFRYKPYITQIKGTLKRYLEQLDNSIKYIDAKIEVHKQTNILEKVKPLKGGKTSKPKITDFDQLFNLEYRDKIDDFINILKNNDLFNFYGLPPLVNARNEWIGNKAAAKVFYDQLLLMGIVQDVSQTSLGNIFSAKFSGLRPSFSGSNQGHKALDYKIFFEMEIGKIIR